MKLEQLFEDQEQDKQFRNQALDVYNKFVDFVEQYGFEGFRQSPNGDYYILSSTDLGIDHTLPFQIRIRITDKDQKGIEDNVKILGGVDSDKRILIFFIDTKILDIFEDFVKNPKQRSMFVHELTHLYDSDRTFKQIKGSAQSSNAKDYYNSPAELNAYFQEGVDVIEQKLEIFHEKVKSKPEMYDTLQNFINTKFGGDDFNKFLEVSLGWFDQDFINHLSDENMKKIKKRLYQYYIDNKNELFDLTQHLEK